MRGAYKALAEAVSAKMPLSVVHEANGVEEKS